MKKYLMSIFTFILMFTFIGSVSAKENIEISNVSISDKTNTMVAKVESFNGLTLNTKESFYEVNDYVTYSITIKNTTGKSLSVDKISDSINNEYIETSYIYDKKEIKNNEEYSFDITLKYKKEITDDSVKFNLPINIVIDYTNGSSTRLLVNPDTKDNVLIYFIIFVLSAISLVLFKTKKNKLLVFVIALGLVPSIAYASSKLTITMNNEIGIYKRLAIMDTGRNVNSALKELAGTDISTDENILNVVDSYIKHIVRARELPSDITDNNIISIPDSVVPIYAWFNNETIYYYTEADTIYLNENSFGLFANLSKVEDIDVSIFNTSNVTNIKSMFYGCESLKNVNVSNFDTSNVTNMNSMFYGCSELKNIDVSNFDTSKVTDMRAMFYNCLNLEEIDTSRFNTSKVTDMGWLFGADGGKVMKLTELDLSNFDTSNVTSMAGMFHNATNLRKLIVNKFDTSKVTTMRYMFCDCSNLTELDVSNFDTSKVTDMYRMFYNLGNTTTIYVGDKFNTDNVTSSSQMFYNTKKIVGGNGTIFDSTKIDKEYARVDKEGTPGYFTLKNS